jgi:hypothetical protein
MKILTGELQKAVYASSQNVSTVYWFYDLKHAEGGIR